jgi:GT2 family glycosyltransferase
VTRSAGRPAGAGGDPLRRVVLAISAFRSDEQILRLLRTVFEQGGYRLARVIVVDSLGSGVLAEAIEREGWPVRYVNASTNLGSAGNLSLRLRLAAEEDADWCFAINHDGMYDADLIGRLAAKGAGGERIGAVYPKRIWIDRGDTWLDPHVSVFHMPRFRGRGAEVRDVPQEVAWDSSNGALYALAPIRQGVAVWADLWMGWEDLAYGWSLNNAGWRQLFCADAEYRDDYEYQPVRLFGREYFIARKPAWYAYYLIRNIVLIVRRTKPGWPGWSFLLKRLSREFAFTILFREQKVERLKLLTKGLIHGLRGRTGVMA